MAARPRARPVTVSLPEPLLAELDRLVEEAPFAGRSEAVRAALLPFLAEQRASKQGRQTAVLAVCFGKGEERRVAALKHDYGDIVRTMLHTHVQGDDCVEVFVVEGSAQRVDRFFSGLTALRGVHLVRRTAIPGHEALR